MAGEPLLYVSMYHGELLLGESHWVSGNFHDIAVSYLRQRPPDVRKFSCHNNGRTFNYLVEDGFTFCVVASESAGDKLPNALLERIKKGFNKKYGQVKPAFVKMIEEEVKMIEEEVKKAANRPISEYVLFRCFPNTDDDLRRHGQRKVETPALVSVRNKFGRKLEKYMRHCVHHHKFAKMDAHVSEIQTTLVETVVKVYDRHEKIDVLLDKTENLRSEAQDFKRKATKTEIIMLVQNKKIKLILSGIIIALMLTILWRR